MCLNFQTRSDSPHLSTNLQIKMPKCESRSKKELLNCLQENIDRTIEAMDHVIAFYNVSKEVEPTVAQGPSAVPIEQFLHTLSRLKRALDYFERNNPKSIEVENVR